MKEYTKRMVVRGFRHIVIDLKGCELMDSTFMGTLAGIALRLRELGSGELTVINANERNTSLLENLGLDHLFSFQLADGIRDPHSDANSPSDEISTPPVTDSEDQRSTMLSAHQTLVDVSPDNEAKFRDVLELLKQEPSTDSSDS